MNYSQITLLILFDLYFHAWIMHVIFLTLKDGDSVHNLCYFHHFSQHEHGSSLSTFDDYFMIQASPNIIPSIMSYTKANADNTDSYFFEWNPDYCWFIGKWDDANRVDFYRGSVLCFLDHNFNIYNYNHNHNYNYNSINFILYHHIHSIGQCGEWSFCSLSIESPFPDNSNNLSLVFDKSPIHINCDKIVLNYDNKWFEKWGKPNKANVTIENAHDYFDSNIDYVFLKMNSKIIENLNRTVQDFLLGHDYQYVYCCTDEKHSHQCLVYDTSSFRWYIIDMNMISMHKNPIYHKYYMTSEITFDALDKYHSVTRSWDVTYWVKYNGEIYVPTKFPNITITCIDHDHPI